DIVCFITKNGIKPRVETRICIGIENVDDLSGRRDCAGDTLSQSNNDFFVYVLSNDGAELASLLVHNEYGASIDTDFIADNAQNDPCKFIDVERGIEQLRCFKNPMKPLDAA